MITTLATSQNRKLITCDWKLIVVVIDSNIWLIFPQKNDQISRRTSIRKKLKSLLYGWKGRKKKKNQQNLLEKWTQNVLAGYPKPTSKLENFPYSSGNYTHPKKRGTLNEPTKWTKMFSRLFCFLFFVFVQQTKAWCSGAETLPVHLRRGSGFREDGKIVHLRTVKTIISFFLKNSNLKKKFFPVRHSTTSEWVIPKGIISR